MGARVYSHGPRPGAGLHGLRNRKFSRTGFTDYRERAIPAARECLAVIHFRGVDARANWQVSEHLAVVDTHHNNLLWLAAADEEPSLFRVDGHSHRRTARRNRPTRDDLARFDIDHHHFILVHQVDVDFARSIRSQELRLAAERDRIIDLSACRIYVRLQGHKCPAVT